MTRYGVTGDNQLVEQGTVSFANFGLTSGGIDDWGLTFVSPTKAYLWSSVDGTSIVWNPSTMDVLSELPLPPELQRAGFTLDTSPGIVRGNRLYRSLYWADYDLAELSTDQVLLVYDPGLVVRDRQGALGCAARRAAQKSRRPAQARVKGHGPGRRVTFRRLCRGGRALP